MTEAWGDALFESGPHDKQVRPVWLGAMAWRLRIGDVIHEYVRKRTIMRDDVVLGFVFRYVGRAR